MYLLVVGENHALGKALTGSGHRSTFVHGDLDVPEEYGDHDAAVVDLSRSGRGFGVIARLRAVSTKPVVVLSGRAHEGDVVRALRLGADDYVFKPVTLAELITRVKVATRKRPRSEQPALPAPAAPPVTARGITVDLTGRTVHRDGRAVELTRTEFDVLAVLCERPGQAVERDQILDRVWGDTLTSTSRSLSVHLTQLRAKLSCPGLITTIRGHGYRFD